MKKKRNKELEVSTITELIRLYTSEAETYDRSSFNACIGCFGIVGGIFTVLATLFTSGSGGFGVAKTIGYVLVMVVPSIVALFMYIFAMNCRRVAMYRGCLKYLEETLNTKIKRNIAVYSLKVIPRYMDEFHLNKYGPIAMVVFTVLAILLSLFVGLNSVKNLTFEGEGVKYLVFVALIVYMAFCLLVCVLAMGGLVKNGQVSEMIYQQCCENYNSQGDGEKGDEFIKRFR